MIRAAMPNAWGVLIVACVMGGSPRDMGQWLFAAEPAPACATQAKTFAEVAKLFRRGKEGVSIDRLKELLTACADAHDPDQAYDNQDDPFYDSVEQLARYLDSHRLECANILSLRKWLAGTCTVAGGEGNGNELGNQREAKPLAFRLGRVHYTVWLMAKNETRKCEPQHAICLSVLLSNNIGYPELRSAVVRLRRILEQRNAVPPTDLNAIEKFLLSREREPLRLAVLHDLKVEAKASGIPEYWEAGEHAQRCLDNKTNPVEFERHLGEFMRCYAKTLKGLPDFATGEKYFLARFLRGVWNMVQSHGSERAKASLATFARELHEHFMKASDTVTSTWLEQAVAPPGPCPEVFVEVLEATPQDPAIAK
jgi:hypothetical protein